MQDRVLPQFHFNPQDTHGQRIDIAAASQVCGAPMTIGRKHHIWATIPCWIMTGAVGVVATGPIPPGGPVSFGGSFPLAPGMVYEYTPSGAATQYVAVIEDPNYPVAITPGWLFIGQAEL